MMTYMLENNLNALAPIDPDLAAKIRQAGTNRNALISAARTGRPYLEIDGVSLCSRFDPDAEAKTMADRVYSQTLGRGMTKIAVFGMGLGYHVAAMARLFDRVSVIEPRVDLIRLAFEHLDFRDVLARLTFLFDPSQVRPDWQTVMFIYPPSLRLSPGAVAPWRNLWPDWNPNTGETRREFNARLKNIDGMDRLGSHLEETAPAEIEILAHQARCGAGPLTQAEQLVLLLDELAHA